PTGGPSSPRLARACASRSTCPPVRRCASAPASRRASVAPGCASRSPSTATRSSRARSTRRRGGATGAGSTSAWIWHPGPTRTWRSPSRPRPAGPVRSPARPAGRTSASCARAGAHGRPRARRRRASSSCWSIRCARTTSAATARRRARAPSWTASPAAGSSSSRRSRSPRGRCPRSRPSSPGSTRGATAWSAPRPTPVGPPAPPGVRPEVAAGRVDPLARRLGSGALAAAEVEHLRRLYDGEIRAWDAELGTLLDALAARGVTGSTIVVLTADHGEEFQEHGRLKHRIHLYDELLHVPLVIAGPGVRPARVAEQTQGIDLFPTLARPLGAAPPPGLPGHDLLAARPEAPAISETLYGLMPDGATTPIVSLLTTGWKLIHAPALGRYELYDLVRDPAEREDRFASAPEGARLAARLAEWETTAPAPPRAEGHD